MAEKVWYKVEISLSTDQNVEIYPDEGYDGIVVKGKEIDTNESYRIYLNRNEMELLIAKMKEMMDFTENN
jgi:hypothetical protein